MVEHIAFLGTGLIGRAMAERALEQGHAVAVWNRTRAKAEPLAALGARVCDTASDAVRAATRVHLIVSDDAAVDDVLATLGETPALIIDHTTTTPAGTIARVVRMTQAGRAFLHAPIFMSPAGARTSRGLILAAGARDLFERAEPALQQMTTTVKWLGERADLAAAYKLFGNAASIGLTAALADIFSMAAELAIAPHDALSLFDVFDPALVLKYRGKAMAAGNFDPSFELSMARKDVRLMLETAGARPLAVLPAIAARMSTLIAQGHGQEDLGVLAFDALRGSST